MDAIKIGTITGWLLMVASTSVWSDVLLSPSDCVGGAEGCWAVTQKANYNADFIQSLVGTDKELFKSYKSDHKSDQGGGEEGSMADSYTTTYDNTTNDPADALIKWIEGTSAIECPECYLSIKGGHLGKDKDVTRLYVFDLSFWDGKMSIDLQDFWPGKGAISNVVIWVPTPPTLGLLGVVLIGLSIISRRRLAD